MLAKKPYKLTRGATNKTKREDPKQGKQWEKHKLYSLHLSQKLFLERTPLPLRVESCIVFVFCARCSTRKKFWSHCHSSVCVCACVCVPCQTISAGLLKVFAAFCVMWVRGRRGGEVGPLEAQCRPFNDAASGKFVQIVYGYCTFIHTAEHTKRDRERGG